MINTFGVYCPLHLIPMRVWNEYLLSKSPVVLGKYWRWILVKWKTLIFESKFQRSIRTKRRRARPAGSGPSVVELRTTKMEHSFFPPGLFHFYTQHSKWGLKRLISSPCLFLHMYIEDPHRHRLAAKLKWDSEYERVQHNAWHSKVAQKVGVCLYMCSFIPGLLSGMSEYMTYAHIWAHVPMQLAG